MKIAASYLSSPFDTKKTIELLDNSIVDFIHVDLMDGKYVPNKNFTINQVIGLLGRTRKPLSIHLMCEKPEKYLDELAMLNADCIIFHPSTTKNPIELIDSIKSLGIKVGIAINPDEELDNFKEYFGLVDEILIMSVVPGKGGQEFIESVVSKIESLISLKTKYNFLVSVDGGINDETIKLIPNIDMAVSGSYICYSNNYNTAINSLKNIDF